MKLLFEILVELLLLLLESKLVAAAGNGELLSVCHSMHGKTVEIR